MNTFLSTLPGASIMLIIGFVLLVKGADYFVDGASNVATRFKIPSLIVGLTIVAMGTSLPECSVSATAALVGNNGLAIGNAIGSNIFNLMVVLGACSLFCPLIVEKSVIKREFPFTIGCALLLLILGFINMQTDRVDGIILLAVFTAYIVYTVKSALQNKKRDEQETEDKIELLPIWKTVIYIIGGAAAIKFGGDFVVDSASIIALKFGMSETLVGLTICAFGTSLPELVTSIVAARKNELNMAVGNVVGSNIFNILMVLGIATTISPIAFTIYNIIDIIILICFSIIALILCVKNKKLTRKDGILFILLYIAYIIYICLR